jgi:hypothetical protein
VFRPLLPVWRVTAVFRGMLCLLQPFDHTTRRYLAFEVTMFVCSALAGLVTFAAGIQSDRFDMKEHPLDWGTLNATRGFCGMAKCYFPARLSEQEVGLAC